MILAGLELAKAGTPNGVSAQFKGSMCATSIGRILILATAGRPGSPFLGWSRPGTGTVAASRLALTMKTRTRSEKARFHWFDFAHGTVLPLGSGPARCLGLLAACLVFTATSSQANVYATNVRINGSATGTTLYYPCFSVEISYVLNEPASAGLTIDFLDGDTVRHSIVAPGGGPGTERGEHRVMWYGKNDQGEDVPFVPYTVRITAASYGYGEWTQISDDYNPGNYAWEPTSIAVNRNTNSPHYGRVFLANASPGPGYEVNLFDQVGIYTLNADGSRPLEATNITGGWDWEEDGDRPWKLEISADDYLYVNDPAHKVVLRFDQNLSPASRRIVLREDNQPVGASFHGLTVAGSGTNAHLWMADMNSTNSLGIRRWRLLSDGTVAENDLGVTLVQAGGDSDLSIAPGDVALDASNRIYTVQNREAVSDSTPRLLSFPPYTDGAPVLTNAAWQRFSSVTSPMRGASGVAVGPGGNYVAATFAGAVVGGSRTGGRTTVLEAATGRTVISITTDYLDEESHDHLDVAWDNAGNLYTVDHEESVWRVYSPPGSNAAVTVAPGQLRLATPPLWPILTTVGHANGHFDFYLTGRTNLDYIIQASTNLHDWRPVATNSDVCATRLISVKAPEKRNFYRGIPSVIIP